ncbi:MAG: DNA-directed RNA polymerase subunit beta [Planctomycetota bacterium]|nr:DNA-directed RNA polymerase subunit beta [Planctomycetota bacterium]NDG62283.1 DNA-directed RNA polymerase subunit beta [Planctomycetota bacterium]
MTTRNVRDYSKRGDAIPVPNLTRVQQDAYTRFLQKDLVHEERKTHLGLQSLLREVFPIESYDGNMKLEFVSYSFGEPQHTESECRELRLTYGYPWRVKMRLKREDSTDVLEEDIYLGDIPILLGGGEFVVNGSERVIVSQLHRSPGVDFSIASSFGDRPLHSARIIPERGSWIELEVTKKDVLAMRIDQSTKLAATTFLRAMDEKFSSSEKILELFYEVEDVRVEKLKPEHYSAELIIDQDTGEELCKIGVAFGDKVGVIQASPLKTVRAICNPGDPLILNTLAEEKLDFLAEATEYEAALLRLYARLRPGNPPQTEKAKDLFAEKFLDTNRYRLGRVGRFRVNRKFADDPQYKQVGETAQHLRAEDFLAVIRYIMELRRPADPNRRSRAHIDDIDHLGNRRLRTLDELATEEMRKGFLKLKRTVQERMSVKDPTDTSYKIADLVNSKSISSAIEFFFGRSELSQVVDQTNPLSMLVHERRLSALGPGGLNRKRAGFEVRDVHISHYGRICPIETPEGANIGLIASLGIYAEVDDYGFLLTPYREITSRKATGKTVRLRADEEIKSILAPSETVSESGKIDQDLVLVRKGGELVTSESTEVQFVDISPKQTVGVSAALIPFLEHDDANRALMGSNMQRQAVPLIKVDPPLVATGMERVVGRSSGMIVRAERAGIVTFVDAERIIIDNADEYALRKFVGLNEKTCQNQKPIVQLKQKVKAGEILADGASTSQGELAIGKNVLVAFNTFDGYNFEDAIVISERLVKDDTFTSIHIESFDVEVRETKLGRQEFTADIPNVSESALRNLDEHGVIRVGARVMPGDILVGKVSPKSKSELSPEEKLLHAIFGRAGEDVKNDSLDVPAGTEGVVIGTKSFSRRQHQTDEQKKLLKKQISTFEQSMDAKAIQLFRQMASEINRIIGTEMVDPSTRQKIGASDIPDVIIEQIDGFSEKWIKGSKESRDLAMVTYGQFWPRIQKLLREKERRVNHMKRGDELPSGVLEMVKVYLATKRQLSVGDKMAGRHGNKGVIARIVPEADMPFMEDGTPVEVLLNPLGVPSRMNVGQILETHLGWAARILGFQAITPVFDGAKESEIFDAIREANTHVNQRVASFEKTGENPGLPNELLALMPEDGKVQLYDGRTGESFNQRTSVGYMYLLKLHHLVDDKIHARSTGPYSLITQQPLGGKARTGGQRFGEMEVWALEAYGAAYVLQELLTVKSDDTEGRQKIYESMVKGDNTLQAGMPVVFDVLCQEIKGLCLNIQLEKVGGEAAAPVL